jgi:hypothetical protein
VKIGVPSFEQKPIEKGSFKSNIRMEKGYNETPQRAAFKYKATMFTRRLACFNEILTSLPWLHQFEQSVFVRVLYGFIACPIKNIIFFHTFSGYVDCGNNPLIRRIGKKSVLFMYFEYQQ